MMRIKQIGITLLIILMTITGVNAQENVCDDAVLEAKRYYESGDLNKCISRLEPCLSSISDKDLLATAYRLMGLAYLAENDSEKAHEYAILLLKTQPEYQKFPQIDPPEFTKIINSYKVEKKVWFGMRAGLNQNMIERIASYSSYQSSQSYLVSRGYQAGIFCDYVINENFYLSSFAYIGGISIRHDIDDLDKFRQEYNEEQRYTGIQLSANGKLALSNNIHLNFGVGSGLSYLFESNVELRTINKETKSVQTYTVSVAENRNRYQPSLFGGVGISFALGKGELMFNFQYDHFLKNTLSDEHRYADPDFNLSNHYVNDDIRNRTFSYNIGFRHPIVIKIKKINK